MLSKQGYSKVLLIEQAMLGPADSVLHTLINVAAINTKPAHGQLHNDERKTS